MSLSGKKGDLSSEIRPQVCRFSQKCVCTRECARVSVCVYEGACIMSACVYECVHGWVGAHVYAYYVWHVYESVHMWMSAYVCVYMSAPVCACV